MNKEEMYLDMKRQALEIKDGLGKPIDAGILELVIYLNLFNVQTVQSCEGHEEGYFFVDFKFWCYKQMNTLLTECFGRNRPFEYTFIYDTVNKEHIIRLEPIMKKDIAQMRKDLTEFEAFLKTKYKSL